MKYQIIFGLILALLSPLTLLYASDDDIVYLKVGNDTVRAEIQSAFEAYRGPLYSDPALPALMLVSKSKKIAAGIGGYVRFTTSLDFAGVMPSNDFIPALIPIPTDSRQRSQFRMEASTSRVYLRVLAQTAAGILHFYVDTDFRALGSRNRFNALYASLSGWRLGRYWTVMADLDAYPPSIDFQGPNAFAGINNYQLSYQGALSKHWTFGAGIELPDYSLADSLSDFKLPQRIPTLPFYIQYQSGPGHIRLGGLFRPLIYRNPFSGRSEYPLTWMGVLSGIYHPVPRLTLYAMGVYGCGTGTYSFEFNGLGLDLLPDSKSPGKLRPARFSGGFVGVKYDFNSFFQMSAILSRMHLYRNGSQNPDFYRIGEYGVLTSYFSLTENLQLAFEYNVGSLTLYNHLDGRANRFLGMIRYDF